MRMSWSEPAGSSKYLPTVDGSEIRRSPPGMYKKNLENKGDKLHFAQLVWKRRISVINNTTHGTGPVYLPTWMVDCYGFHVGKYTGPVPWMVWVFPKIGVPQTINSNRVFPYKPFILGYHYHYFWNTRMGDDRILDISTPRETPKHRDTLARKVLGGGKSPHEAPGGMQLW